MVCIGAVALLVVLATGLAINAIGIFVYGEFVADRVINVAIHGNYSFSAAGTNGVQINDLRDKRHVATLDVVPPARHASDLSIATSDAGGAWLFVLDADCGGLGPACTRTGHVTAFDVRDTQSTTRTTKIDMMTRMTVGTSSHSVPVGPYSGISAAGGRIVVSGGNKELSVFTYSETTGELAEEASSVKLARSQPDVLIHPSGGHAFVSTWFASGTAERDIGEGRGVTAILLNDPPAAPTTLARIAATPEATLTFGATRPANFPLVCDLGGGDGALLVCADVAGLHFVNVTAPAAPYIIGHLDLADTVNSVHVAVYGGRAFVVGWKPAPGRTRATSGARSTLVEVDIAGVMDKSSYNITSAKVIKTTLLPLTSNPTGVAVNSKMVVVAASGIGEPLFFQRDDE